MKCTVYRSSNRDFTYIYLRNGYSFDNLPRTLQNVFGEHQPVMTLDLTPERKLAYEDVNQVMKNLTDQGYHLQMPPTEDVTGLLELPEKEEKLL